ncbi:hypothetical protein M4D57_23815 [Brevibacillus borstelensis]|nr:hypothetical protein [Brevibacillus borstelensis]MCM3561566.1 hypothetical protein [Brevibacillus borstelensis]
MLQQFKKSLEQNGITLSTRFHQVKEYLNRTQNEMTAQDTINCFPEFYTEIRSLDLSDSGKKLVVEIVLDPYNPFEYDRAASDLIGKVEYKYECDIKVMTLLELLFLVQFAHMYLGETSHTGVCHENESVKLINFNKTEVFVYRVIQDDLYYDGQIFEGKFTGDRYKQASMLLNTDWVSEVRFLDDNCQVTCWKSKNDIGKLECTKEYYLNEKGVYPDNYFAIWTYLEADQLYSLKDMQTLAEIMDCIRNFPPREYQRIEVFEDCGEELPF